MSLGYAERLSHREDLGGRLGDPELADAPHEVFDKACKLAELIRDSNKVIVFTGAGISTSTGIPDFRGPQGVWTLQRKGLPLPKLQTSFVYAKPSLTHQALLGLLQSGNLTYICSQNVDSLHLRSGMPREQLAELHGNCFAERCKKCKTEYVRDFEMDTVGFKQTGRRCTQPDCRGMLVDHILDWEDALPPAEFKATQQHATDADLALCLGTSLQIIPAANLPLRTVKAGGKLGIINLQATPKDKRADVVIHARVDEIMSLIMQRVGVAIPVYTRTDRVLLSHTITAGAAGGSGGGGGRTAQAAAAVTGVAKEQQQPGPDDMTDTPPAAAAEDAEDDATAVGSSSSWVFTFSISSIHGPSCPLPMVASASVSFVGAAAGALKPRELSGQLPWKLSRSCPDSLQEVVLQVQLQLVDAADEDKRSHQVQYVITKPQQLPDSNSRAKSTRRAASQLQQDGSQVFAFITQQLDYADRQQQLIEKLEAEADQSRLAAPAAAEAAAAATQSRKRDSSSKRSNSKQQQDGSSSGGTAAGAAASEGMSTGQGRSGSQGKSSKYNSNADAQAADGGADESDGSSDAGDESSDDDVDYGDAGNDDKDSDYNVGDGSDAEPTGQAGQNSSGRPRKRTKRLDL